MSSSQTRMCLEEGHPQTAPEQRSRGSRENGLLGKLRGGASEGTMGDEVEPDFAEWHSFHVLSQVTLTGLGLLFLHSQPRNRRVVL